MPQAVAVVMGGLLLGGGCGDAGEGPANVEPPPKVTVVLGPKAYRPAQIEIRPGTRVTWVNGSREQNTVETRDVGFVEHDREAMAARGQFDLHILSTGEAESIVFGRPGVYRYTSSLDSDMRGVVRVARGAPRSRPARARARAAG